MAPCLLVPRARAGRLIGTGGTEDPVEVVTRRAQGAAEESSAQVERKASQNCLEARDSGRSL